VHPPNSSSLVHIELSWWGLGKALCIYMSHTCIIAVTAALDLSIKQQQPFADMLARWCATFFLCFKSTVLDSELSAFLLHVTGWNAGPPGHGMRSQHHACHIDSSWMVCAASFSLHVTGAPQKLSCFKSTGVKLPLASLEGHMPYIGVGCLLCQSHS
jgi:hypothetical protein